MENSKQYLKDNKIIERISFKDGKKHRVKLVKDKMDKITDAQGVEKEGVKYMVLENGEPRTFFTSSIGLIQKLSSIAEDTEVEIQMKSKKGDKGFISYFDVDIINETEQTIHSEENDPFDDLENPEQEQ